MLGKLGRYVQKKKKKKLDHLTPYTRINSQWIKDLNVRLETIIILEENIGNKISDISLSNMYFWYISLDKLKNRKNKWNYIIVKSFCTEKETINKMKRQPTERKNIFTNDTSDKGLISKIYQELKKPNTKKKSN